MKNYLIVIAVGTLLSACSSDSRPPQNQGPLISTVADQTLEANTSSAPLSVALSDDTTTNPALGFNASSSNTVLLPNAAISIDVVAGGRSIVITPTPGVIGVATVTLTVSDTLGASQSSTFSVTVNRQELSFAQLLRSVFYTQASDRPQELDSLIIIQDAQNDDFADLL